MGFQSDMFSDFLSDGHTNLCRLLGTWPHDMGW